MNSAKKNSSIKLLENSSRILLLLFAAAFAAASAASAQSINNDLAPKKTVKKSSTAPKTSRPPVKSRPRPIARRPVAANPVVTQPVSTVPLQTPPQIIDRFMDLQQSSSVTVKDWESVVSQTNASLQGNPNDPTTKAQLFIGQGQLAFLRGDFSNALIHFNGAAQVLPDSALPVYCIGRVYLVTKQPVEAEKAFERATKLNKTFALAFKGWGDAMTAQGKTKKAQEYYKQAAKIGLAGGGGGSANTSGAANSTTNQGGNPGDASQSNGGAGTPAAPTVTPYDADLKSAKQLTARKKWQSSLDKLTALSKTNPTTEVYIAIGDNYYGMRQWLSAQQAYRKAAEINPNSALGYYKIGQVMFQMNEFQSAYEAFEKSLILDQNGSTINRPTARKMADQANQKANDLRKSGDGKGKKLLFF